jgi:transposase
MLKKQMAERNQWAMVCLEDLVPEDHLVRQVDAALDFSFIYDLVAPFYSEVGRPSVH